MNAMMFWLDWKLFGNGHGMASPYFDDVFYWLNGRFYQFFGGLGAQLQSHEWRTPNPGTRRKLIGEDFVVCGASRHWLRVRVMWARSPKVKDFAEVEALKRKLQAWGHGL